MAHRLLLLFAAVLAVALAPGAHAAKAENRLGALLSAANAHTGPEPPAPRSPHQATTAPKPGIAAGCCVATKPGAGAGRSTRFVTTPRGTTFDIPKGWAAREADNGKGIVYQRPGATGNADMVRIMEPTAKYPKGYFRYYNEHGQPLAANGKPGPNSATHFPEDYQGPTAGWPRDGG